MATAYGSRNAPIEGRKWQFAWCEFIELNRQLQVHGQPVRIEAKPADVLVLLLERSGDVLTKDELIGAAWSNTPEGASDNSLTTAIRKLRAAFGGARDEVILTAPNVGYRMAVPVVETVVSESQPSGFSIEAGEPMPQRPHWKAQRPLDAAKTVWLAEHIKTHEVRVFKFAVDGIRLRALQREVTLSRLLQKSLADTRGFVRVMDWSLEELPYFTESEYGGVNLHEAAGATPFKALSLEGRVALATGLVETVAAAHSLGILHNDLKPSNVLILENMDGVPGSLGIKVADFGVASLSQPERLRQMEITQHGFAEGDQPAATPVGTGIYRAPEILAGGPPSTLADVYALGVMLYQIACGDFVEPLSPGWESRIPDPLLREDIAAAANLHPACRIATAADLATRLRTVEARRAAQVSRSAEVAQQERDRQELERERLRRPWLAFAMLALIAGLCASLWFARRTDRARRQAEQSNRTLTDMNRFMVEDLLAQSNPITSAPGSVPQVTLIEAIGNVLPQIDHRFANAPRIAAQLYLTIGAALDARTDFVGAADQFEQAAQHFRQADGPLSQDAIVAELRRENSQMRSHVATSISAAKAGFATQQLVIASLRTVGPELDAWRTIAASWSLMYSSNPEPAVALLNRAVWRGQTTPGFDPLLLTALETRLVGIYLRLADGSAAERAARHVIATIQAIEGPESRTLLEPRMYLQEAFYMESRYKEALAQGDENYSRFLKILGPTNQLTLAALTMRAETEGAMEDYADAIRDQLALSTLERSLPSGAYLAESNLSDVAEMECRSNHMQAGMAHARQVIVETGKSRDPQPEFLNRSTFTLAECIIIQQESERHMPRPEKLAEANRLLTSVNLETLTQSPGLAEFEGSLDTAKARLALLEGQYALAEQLADNAAPYQAKSYTDNYERRALAQVRAALTAQRRAVPRRAPASL